MEKKKKVIDETVFEIQKIAHKNQPEIQLLNSDKTKKIGQVKYLPKIFFYDILFYC